MVDIVGRKKSDDDEAEEKGERHLDDLDRPLGHGLAIMKKAPGRKAIPRY